MSAQSQVHLSTVVVGRNDGYGGDFLEMLRCFAQQLCSQIEVQSGSFELNIVEWNPPADRPRLRDELKHIVAPANLSVRIVEVPPAIHETFRNSDRIPLFEYIGKNAGIRRARGSFVLATNPDVLFSDALIDFLGSGELREDGFYRTDRHDFTGAVSANLPVRENVRSAVATTTLRHLFRRSHERREEIVEASVPYLAAAGDFFLAHRAVWDDLRGYRELTTSGHMDSILCYEAIDRGHKQFVLPSDMNIFHREHDRSERLARPGTPLDRWRELVAADDLQQDRSDWGLATASLPEFRLQDAS